MPANKFQMLHKNHTRKITQQPSQELFLTPQPSQVLQTPPGTLTPPQTPEPTNPQTLATLPTQPPNPYNTPRTVPLTPTTPPKTSLAGTQNIPLTPQNLPCGDPKNFHRLFQRPHER